MSLGRLLMIGAQHRALPESVHEQIAHSFEAMAAGALPAGLKRHVGESRLFRTCARSELFMVSADPAATIRSISSALDSRIESDLPSVSHLRFATSAAAVRHLFRTASGLESAVLGEAEVLGQVRDVLKAPAVEDFRGPILHRLFQEAVEVGRQVRAETDIGVGRTSLSSAAVDWAEGVISGTQGRTALVIGAGRTGRAIGHRLRKGRWKRVLVLNRTIERAVGLAREIGAEALTLGHLSEALQQADVVFAAVPLERPLVTLLDVAEARHSRPEACRVLVDLSHPRAIERCELDGIQQLDLTRLQDSVEEAREGRSRWIPEVEARVEAAVDRYVAWLRGRSSVAALVRLREHVMTAAMDEAHRAGRGLDQAERERLSRLARSIARSVLHGPTRAMRDADPADVDEVSLVLAVRELFAVELRGTEAEEEQHDVEVGR